MKRQPSARLRRVLLVSGLLVLAWAMVPRAQDRRLLDSNGYVRDDAYPRPLVPAADQKYLKIDGLKMKDTLKEVVAISLKSRDDGNKYWGRIAGSKYEAMMHDWVEARFKRYNLQDVHRQPFKLPTQWFPTDWSYTFTAGGKTYNFKSVNPSLNSPATPAAGLDLDVVWVGTGTAADFAGRDVKGKAVLIHSIPAPGSMGHSAAYERAMARAFEKGAAAIGVVYGISDNFAIWQGLGGAGEGGPGQQRPITTPGFFMGFQDGKVIRDLIGAGEPVKLHMTLTVEMREGLSSSNVWGTLPGTTDENIIVIAHQDGYYEAALDNASGQSVMMTLLDYFSQIPKEQRRRSITFVATAGHHVGSPGTRWMHDNRDTVLAKTVLMINCEHVSVSDTKYWNGVMRKANVVAPRRWWINGSERLFDTVLKSYGTFGVGLIADMDPNASGDMGIVAKDVPSIQIIRSPVTKHTDDDKPEWVPAAGLEAVARSYARIIDNVNKLEKRDLVPVARTSTAGQ
jgi:peptidase M28-like protein